jgi:putative ABC transport system ATP-binding protein
VTDPVDVARDTAPPEAVVHGEPGATALIAFREVGVDGPDGPILAGVSADVPARGITVIVGPSGSGKSTLLRLANRLDAADRGRVIVLGDDVAQTDTRLLRRRLGMVFQRPAVFPGTVGDNLRVADQRLDDAGARELLARVALPAELLGHDAGTLSGGEAQRLCIARALAAGPDALLMDEPTSSLDPASRDAIEDLARALAAWGTPVVWVTHDQAQMRRLADTVLVVIAGRVAHAGPLSGGPAVGDPAAARFLGMS